MAQPEHNYPELTNFLPSTLTVMYGSSYEQAAKADSTAERNEQHDIARHVGDEIFRRMQRADTFLELHPEELSNVKPTHHTEGLPDMSEWPSSSTMALASNLRAQLGKTTDPATYDQLYIEVQHVEEEMMRRLEISDYADRYYEDKV